MSLRKQFIPAAVIVCSCACITWWLLTRPIDEVASVRVVGLPPPPTQLPMSPAKEGFCGVTSGPGSCRRRYGELGGGQPCMPRVVCSLRTLSLCLALPAMEGLLMVHNL